MPSPRATALRDRERGKRSWARFIEVLRVGVGARGAVLTPCADVRLLHSPAKNSLVDGDVVRVEQMMS
jgi:hypothetical protein